MNKRDVYKRQEQVLRSEIDKIISEIEVEA